MKKLFLTLSLLAIATGAFAYTLEDLNNDEEERALIAEQNAQDIQDKLDEIQAQLEAQNEQPSEPESPHLTRAQAGFISFGDYAQHTGPDRVDVGQFSTRTGHRVIALYEIKQGQCTQVNLIMPDGSKIKVDIEKGTKPVVIDQSLQRIVDKQP